MLDEESILSLFTSRLEDCMDQFVCVWRCWHIKSDGLLEDAAMSYRWSVAQGF